jgi:hypothetical protein
MRVAHLPQIVGGQGRAEASTAIQDHLGLRCGDLLLDVALDDAFTEVSGAGDVCRGKLALFANIDD